MHLKELVAALVRSVEGVGFVDVTSLEVTHSYTTRTGDILTAVAARVYGDAARWPEIHAANKARIANPDVLTPGKVLRIP